MALKKILVVSKDVYMLSFLGLGLGEDYEVLNTDITDEEGVVAVVSEKKPDLVILAIMIPGAEEIILGLRIRQSTEIPIITLSNFKTGDGKVRIFSPKDRGYLGRDLTVSMLKHLIQRRIQRVI